MFIFPVNVLRMAFYYRLDFVELKKLNKKPVVWLNNVESEDWFVFSDWMVSMLICFSFIKTRNTQY